MYLCLSLLIKTQMRLVLVCFLIKQNFAYVDFETLESETWLIKKKVSFFLRIVVSRSLKEETC